ncbi:MAG: tetratricopeptide repeat protein [Hydrococcus sp. SU_1_0]|nr:tetratricopeptide repeat protein [Hydrococcus sp. SU_1_0]
MGYGQFDEALEVYLQAIKLDPENPVLHYRLGDVFARQGQTTQASNCYRRAVELETNSI